MKRKIAFVVPPNVELLDLAGPLQVFREAQHNGLEIDINFYGWHSPTMSAAGISLGELAPYREAQLGPDDYLFIPGIHMESLQRHDDDEHAFFSWLTNCFQNKVTICAVCTAAFVLGEARLLNGKKCTTHWRSIALLKTMYPQAIVLDDVLYTRDENIYTSAGISAGIDMALDIIEGLKGPLFTHEVARGLVVYQRRDGAHRQESIYLEFRNHINPKIHEIQDYLAKNIGAEHSIEQLAARVSMSPRNLTRVFKEKTGITVWEYLTGLRIEKAKTLLNHPGCTIEAIASECGFKSARQLQRILNLKK